MNFTLRTKKNTLSAAMIAVLSFAGGSLARATDQPRVAASVNRPRGQLRSEWSRFPLLVSRQGCSKVPKQVHSGWPLGTSQAPLQALTGEGASVAKTGKQMPGYPTSATMRCPVYRVPRWETLDIAEDRL